MGDRPGWREISTLALPFLLWGCVTTLPYTPQRDLIDRFGEERVHTRLQSVIEEAIQPHILRSVYVTPEVMRYQFSGAFQFPFVHEIYFVKVARIDVRDDNRAYLFDNQNHEICWLEWPTVEQAMEFASLVMSCRAEAFRTIESRPSLLETD